MQCLNCGKTIPSSANLLCRTCGTEWEKKFSKEKPNPPALPVQPLDHLTQGVSTKSLSTSFSVLDDFPSHAKSKLNQPEHSSVQVSLPQEKVNSLKWVLVILITLLIGLVIGWFVYLPLM